LSEARISDVDLSDANLSHANLSGAGFIDTNLSGADLTNALAPNKEFLIADRLDGATMPDGQKYEEWLKSEGRGEDGENGGPS